MPALKLGEVVDLPLQADLVNMKVFITVLEHTREAGLSSHVLSYAKRSVTCCHRRKVCRKRAATLLSNTLRVSTRVPRFKLGQKAEFLPFVFSNPIVASNRCPWLTVLCAEQHVSWD